MRTDRTSLGLILVAALPAAAFAKDLRVPSADYPDITSAAAAAASGDRILVGPGTYTENVVLNAENVQILGKKAVWDGHVGTVGGVCLTLNGAGSTVTGFTFRNGTTHVQVNAARCAVVKCVSRAPSSDNVRFDNAPDGRVERCTLHSSGSYAIRGSSASGLIVFANTVRGADNGGVYVSSADGVRVERNVISLIEDGEGVYVSGADARIVANRIANTDDGGIDVSGDDALVEANLISSVGDGIEVDGERAVVRRNRVTDCVDDSDGIDVSGSNADIDRNVVTGAVEDGITLSGSDSKIRNNVVTFCGTEDDDSIAVTGDRNEIERNRVTDADENGIYVSGTGNVVRGCSVTRSFQNGIYVSGSANEVTGCRVSGCDGQGIENRGTDTKLTASVFSGSRLDVTIRDTGTYVLPLTGVTYRTGGPTTPAEVDK